MFDDGYDGEGGGKNDLSVIVIVIKIIIENNDDDGQSNGDAVGHRCRCNCDIAAITSSTEIAVTSKSTDRPNVQQLYPIQLRYVSPVCRVI